MQQKSVVTFKIQSMDSLGQGVSKESDKITFIPKTLPDETGMAEIHAAKKGVQFGSLKSLSTTSPHRINPLCEHFQHCPSCHYLHTSYEEELRFKTKNLEKLFHKLEHPEIQVTPAARRLGYRNRLQLHYDLRSKKLGMLDPKDHKIAPIPHCLIANSRVSEEMKRLYDNQTWTELIDRTSPDRGHIEIYDHDGEVKVSVNRPYAQGGFTQVFEEMNQLMKEKLQHWSKTFPSSDLLDLFAGNGNLSQDLNHSRRLCIDFYPAKVQDPFLSQDLYAHDALSKVLSHLRQIPLRPTSLVVDPPRSGLKNLSEWLEQLRPLDVAYVSCDPHTLVRDLIPLKNYSISDIHLFDFFPSTFHFETVVFLKRN